MTLKGNLWNTQYYDTYAKEFNIPAVQTHYLKKTSAPKASRANRYTMHPRRHSSKAVTSLFLLCISVALYGQLLFSPLEEQYERRVEEDTQKEVRPIMYTFFQQRENEHGDLLENETQDTEAQIKVWKELWNKAGWDAKVLTIEDAEKHPDFEKYSQDILKENPRLFYGALYKNSYNYMCFIRWLAMSAHGEGGWMSDYDTIPMGITSEVGKSLPNEGAFTGYDRHVPSLLSGSADEWDRMSKLILDEGVENIHIDTTELFSDMMALKNIHEKDESAYIQEAKVSYEYPYLDLKLVDCHRLDGVYAAHLSHHASKEALDKGLIESPNDYYHNWLRPGWALDLDEHWRAQCLSE